MSTVRHALPALLALTLLSVGAAQAQTKNAHSFAAKRTHSIKQAIAGQFQRATGIKGVLPKHVRIASQKPLYVSSGPKPKRGAKLQYDTRTVDFKVLQPKSTYDGNTVSHTRYQDPRATRLSFFAVKSRKRVTQKSPGNSGSNASRADSFLRALAQDAGEYFRPSASYRSHLQPIRLSTVPSRLRRIFAARLGQESRSVRRDGRSQNHAEYGESHAVTDDRGKVTGYVLGIHHYIDHPLWDGSGVNVYYNTRGKKIAEVPWEG